MCTVPPHGMRRAQQLYRRCFDAELATAGARVPWRLIGRRGVADKWGRPSYAIGPKCPATGTQLHSRVAR